MNRIKALKKGVVYRIIGLVICLLLYLFMFHNHTKGNISMGIAPFVGVSLMYWILALGLCVLPGLIKPRDVPVWVSALLFALIPAAAFYISEYVWNPQLFQMEPGKVLWNYVIILAIQVVVFLLSQSVRISCYVTLFWCCLYGMVNYYLLIFRGTTLLPSDVLAVRTAMDVAGNYEFVIGDKVVISILAIMLILCVLQLLAHKKCIVMRPYIGILVAFVWAVAVFNILWSIDYGVKIEAWMHHLTYYANGGFYAFLLEAQAMAVEPPAGYSVKAAENILEEYKVEEGSAEEVRPNVIVIMNEAFTDLEVLGDIDTEEYMPYWKSIEDYVLRGNAYVSVFGGGTCNSEFEFLTGLSMGNLNSQVYPYQVYDLSKVQSIPVMFKEKGYETIAVHAATERNWNRKNVYEQLGFDDFVSLEDMENVVSIRNFPSDVYNYEQVIEAYENAEGPAFVFNITIQNHSGYNDIENLGDVPLVEASEEVKQYDDVVTYLSLIKESDRAFGELLEYFKQEEEPVIICMFGDHLPGLGAEGLETLFPWNDLLAGEMADMQKLYCVPYLIWSNYDIPDSKQTLDTSLNFLGMNVAEVAGIDTAYSKFMLELQQQIPVYNKFGYKTAAGQWNVLEAENEWLNKYRIIQYYMMHE